MKQCLSPVQRTRGEPTSSVHQIWPALKTAGFKNAHLIH